MSVQDIPPLNAALNGIATVLMTIGFVFIQRALRTTDVTARAAHVRAHRACMISAGVVSAIFLVGYVTHKALKGMAAGPGEALHTEFGGEGAIKVIYRAMLFSHIVLAMAIAYLVPRTFVFAFRGNFERHKAWARWTFPIWYYVSITGVLVYFFLYQWWPAVK